MNVPQGLDAYLTVNTPINFLPEKVTAQTACNQAAIAQCPNFRKHSYDISIIQSWRWEYFLSSIYKRLMSDGSKTDGDFIAMKFIYFQLQVEYRQTTLPTRSVSSKRSQVFNLVNLVLGVVFGLISLASLVVTLPPWLVAVQTIYTAWSVVYGIWQLPRCLKKLLAD